MPESTLPVEAERLRHDLEHVRREDLTDHDRAALRSLLGELEHLREGNDVG